MAKVVAKTGIAVGKNRGHVTTKRAIPASKQTGKSKNRPKGVQVVKDIVREVCGFAPYERRLQELLKVGKEKRALKLAKSKLGSHKRAKAKREEMSSVLRSMRAK
ncbi:hypothetical protein KFE25_012625 [Diacronema lutheri]|uniref:60S ribosomal protein L36 n=1 Tax=Diacronema lutheri TaxID=2081491 RepID=A0A8J6C0S5_DIALT|nr:hypothetical protein KFE25_012625 [Diacronema lutheri]